MSRAEMDILGWDSCDVIIVTGDAYVDHPSFGMAIIGRVLEAQGFRVGIIAQARLAQRGCRRPPSARRTCSSASTAGNMDSMVNRYNRRSPRTQRRRLYPGGGGGQRPDRSVIVYAQRAREAFRDVPIVIGGIEASLRRIAHFDYWSEKVRAQCSWMPRQTCWCTATASGRSARSPTAWRAVNRFVTSPDLRGTVFARRGTPPDWIEIDSTHLGCARAAERSGGPLCDGGHRSCPRRMRKCAVRGAAGRRENRALRASREERDRERSVIRMPAYEAVAADPVLYAHASPHPAPRVEPGNARALDRDRERSSCRRKCSPCRSRGAARGGRPARNTSPFRWW